MHSDDHLAQSWLTTWQSSPTPSYQSRRPLALSEIDLVLAQAYPHVAYSYCCHCYYDPECESESQPASPGGMSERSMMEVDRPRTGYGGKRSRRDQGEFSGAISIV